jgi:hypothetical protein
LDSAPERYTLLQQAAEGDRHQQRKYAVRVNPKMSNCTKESNPAGNSETNYDSHSNGGPNGVLADIFAGTPPSVGGVPEPSSIVLFGSVLLASVTVLWRKMGKQQ